MADELEPDDVRSDPFSSLPMFGDLAKALADQGPLNWDAARQFAQLSSTGGAAETNVDPAVRLALGDLARIAWYHVGDVVGSEAEAPEPQVVDARPVGAAARSRPTATSSPTSPRPSARHRPASPTTRSWPATR